jgi:hypothetical protein
MLQDSSELALMHNSNLADAPGQVVPASASRWRILQLIMSDQNAGLTVKTGTRLPGT